MTFNKNVKFRSCTLKTFNFSLPYNMLKIELYSNLAWLFIYTTYIIGIVSVYLANFCLPQMLRYGKALPANDNSSGNKAVKWFFGLKVPHNYFTHFYANGLVLSLINAFLFPSQLLVWLLVIHTVRRLAECLLCTNWGSNSQIHVAHYLVGLWFYTTLNLSIYLGLADSTELTIRGEMHTVKLIAVLLFAVFSFDQSFNHLHLSTLVKYSLPTRGLFKWIACAHYFDELMIYISLFIVNKNTRLATGMSVIWVISNLGVSAVQTKSYYESKFKDCVRPKYAMIPFVL
ncbi:HCL157Cp [Eremothecium sinecaudum]|uniref:Polyprenal reductase n=1 Tax=Eremothecium sinecaudum TaxID=45286 RepID=A0A0X8HRA0_9SACH|nr:HCL157Cp [Eremothecium sinecaudum]AMD19994.1 HCL157Cp [Eremothecium sinecaudum]